MILALGLAALAATGGAPATALRVAAGPIEGAPDGASDALVEALRALPGVSVVDLRGLGQTLGAEALARYQACTDDACRAEAAAAVPHDYLAVAALEGGVLRVRLRADGETRVRVSRDVGEAGLDAAVREVAAELFPVRAAASRSEVRVAGLPSEAFVRVDAAPPVPAEGGRVTLELAPGPHEIEARASGHEPWRGRFEVRLGAPLELGVDLVKRRGPGPWLLGAGGLALSAGAGAFAVLAQLRVDDWSAACAGGACAGGFTRARYERDRSAVDVERAVAAGLGAAGGAAMVAAVLWFVLEPGSSGGGSSFAAGPAGVGVRF